ncbi:hypothetical protein ACFWOJ_20275 [Streptomyces sp. NPDC058439]|uniref:hypothetical protein n=1 Tax=Streptomyces sp. NPDC058439 TaxID=3346500 RepID=UPI00365B8E9A
MRHPYLSDDRTGTPVGPAVTHNTRQPLPVAPPGSDPGAIPASTGCPVEASTSAPVRAPGPDRPLVPAGSGPDRPRRRPDEAETAVPGPQLVLTFGAE